MHMAYIQMVEDISAHEHMSYILERNNYGYINKCYFNMLMEW